MRFSCIKPSPFVIKLKEKSPEKPADEIMWDMDHLSDAGSDYSLDEESIEKDDTVRFEDQIKLHHLKALMEKFAHHKPTDDMPPDGFVTPGRIIKRESGNVTVKEFKEMIHSLFKTTAWDVQMENLFAKVDTSADGMVDWNEFCTYMLLHYRENDNVRKELPFKYEAHYRHVSQNKVVHFHCKYVTLSKEGILCVLDPHFLHIERSYELKTENEDPRALKRRCKTWYTDITVMNNANKIVISSTGRDLRFWDISCPTSFFEEFHLYALPDVPLCLDYWYDPKFPSNESLLIVGDDQGSIHLYHFIKPLDRLFETPFTDKEGVKKIWTQDLLNHQRYVRHSKLSGIHTEMIRKVRYLPENDYIISSSGSRTTSLVLMDTQSKKKTYTFKMSKGVECFDFNKTLNVIATGGIDHSAHLWNPFVQDKPTAYLIGHMMAVVGVAINEATAQVYTYAKDGVVKVWDLREYSCLQTYPMRFPCLQHLRSPEYGSSCLILHRRSLVACCGDYIGTVKLGKTELANHSMPLTHKAQLCCALYNSFFKQVATAADDSTITVWDLTSGAKSFSILEAHNKEDITSMVFNTTGRKMITGARNGTIKVWNFQNGHNIIQFEPVAEAEITGLVSLGKRKGVLAVGWSRQIVFYNDQDAETLLVKANTSWKGGQVHKDDILTVAYCPPNLLATACFDGEIIVWSVETETIFIRLRKGQSWQVSKRLREALASLERTKEKPLSGRVGEFSARQSVSGSSSQSSHNSRPNTRHQTSHRHPAGFKQAPVDKILFLKSRIINKGLTEGAVLISSEAGFLHFWSIYGFSNNHKGCFYASNSVTKEESVLAMTTNHDDSLLITGDTIGHVYVWDVSQYCLEQTGKEETQRPPMMKTWHAHDSAVVSVEYIKEAYGSFVLTASSDCTARLWTIEGHYVGTFGQSKKWNLRNPSTYEHPRSPWSNLEDKQQLQDETLLQSEQDDNPDDDVFLDGSDQAVTLTNNNNIVASDLQPAKDCTDKIDVAEDVVLPGIAASPQPDLETVTEEARTNGKPLSVSLPSIHSPTSSREPVNKGRPKASVSIKSPPLSDSSLPMSQSRRQSDCPVLMPDKLSLKKPINPGVSDYGFTDVKTKSLHSVNTWEDDLSWVSSRSMTLSSLGSYKTSRTQSKSAPSLLGRQVDEDFARITHSRQERRQRCGGVDVKATQRFGKLCSPFQALATLKTDEVVFPTSLPMTPRMLNRGLTCSNEAELRHITLSPTPGEYCRSGFVEQGTSTSPLPAIRRMSRASWNR
ncbi:WD repeat-containing protein on Y chromosome-like [Acanthaster planci]|uniref:WD repeat-containing protein on Y chromosome-like n=1 Tax=Acanthaster planci TaxID=133434 RepID=A0A8B7XXL2_ACAPL|nr:WD repeat-containing protein on Y chromosome-like [Acanthaster planci]